MPDLLIELFSEEIPARMQKRAAADLQKLMTDGLVEAGLTYAHAAAFSTPRRLTLAVEGMLAETPILKDEKKGPSIDANINAIAGYMRGLGIEAPTNWYEDKVEHLKGGGVLVEGLDVIRVEEFKGKRVLMATLEYPSRPAAEIVAEVLERTIRNFPWPKSMRWGSGSLKWVRPLHSIICLIRDDAGATVVPLEVDGIVAGDSTRGHRFLAPGHITVTGFEDYESQLKRAFVVLNPQERADAIWHDATNAAFAAGMEVVEDAGLLSEVAGLVEWPVVLMGPIADDFLDLPPEVLQTSMREHQKFFSVKNPRTDRIEKFVTVANRSTADEGATILAGNEKVLSARLSDAKFFWDNDLRVARSETGMETWVENLKNVTFHNKLGTQADLIERMALLARELAPMVGADTNAAEQAARIAKADLSSEMVYEFPELQGLMGSYYARAAGMSDDVAAAAQEHYAPLGPSDTVPHAPVSVAVALAEKIDKLTGFWAIDEKPTGSKDPFALRRAALGVIRILVENDVSLPARFQLFSPLLGHLIQAGTDGKSAESAALIDGIKRLGYEKKADELHDLIERDAVVLSIDMAEKAIADAETKTEDLVGFLHDRLKVYLRDQGVRHDVIDACISVGEGAIVGAVDENDDLTQLVKRARALNDVLKTDDGENLIQGFKRANNILTQAEDADGVEYSFGADIKFSETDEERALFAALDAADARIKPALAQQDFATAMAAMAALRGPIDAFFDAVQVNSDNGTIRRNRLNLLSQIRGICTSVADLTKLDG